LIRSRIAEDFPHHVVLGEENTAPGAAASVRATTTVAAAEHLWIIDPLDGTANFVHEICLSVVSIAYAHQGHVRLGVVYNPYQDELFFAYHAGGAFRIRGCDAADWIGPMQHRAFPSAPGVGIPASWTPLRVSSQQSLKRAFLASDFPARGPGASERTVAGLNLAASAGSFRSIGAAALQLAWVAAGRLDAYWGYDLNAWDIAAGALLVQEAGGVIGAIGGGSYDLLSRNILATGQQELATILNGSLPL
jgi:myo-inositol-1(or 4)-monophosphatase